MGSGNAKIVQRTMLDTQNEDILNLCLTSKSLNEQYLRLVYQKMASSRKKKKTVLIFI